MLVKIYEYFPKTKEMTAWNIGKKNFSLRSRDCYIIFFLWNNFCNNFMSTENFFSDRLFVFVII